MDRANVNPVFFRFLTPRRIVCEVLDKRPAVQDILERNRGGDFAGKRQLQFRYRAHRAKEHMQVVPFLIRLWQRGQIG